MSEDLVMDIARQAVLEIIVVSAPLLLFALVIGLLISIFQTVTSIQEQTLSFVPKIVAVLICLIIFGPWMMTRLVELTVNLFSSFNTLINS